jgi:tetratricopeptide (TPR) repeat protein
MIRVPPILLLSALGVTATALAQSDGHAPAPSVAPAATHRYALTLLSSFDPIPGNAVPADVKGQRVYRTQSTVFGKTIYFLRLGFFTSAAEAEAAKNQLNARFPGAFVSEITPVEYAEAGHVLPQAPKPAAVPIPRPEPASTPAAVARETLYAITLASGGAGALHPVGPLPDALQSSRLYTHAIKSNGKALGTLNLGFFATAAEAESARRLLATTYPQAQVHAVSRQEKESSENNQLVAPSSPKVTAPAALPPQPSTAENPVDKQAAQLMERGRAALTRGDNPGAIAALNQLLRLPPNRHSQDAQELIGLAHERNNEKILAKQEYALYLKLYPEGDGAERVRQRLAILESPESAPALKAVRQKQTDITMAYGSFSQYYYRGDTHTETGTTVSPLLNQSSLTTTDQSALITNLDFTGRMRSGDYDNRVVVRDGYTSNFLANTENVNRLYSAYFEIKDKALDYSGRLGRQPGNSGGVLGRFDGASLGYGLLPKWRVNVVAGEPVELINPISSTRQFWGASLDMGTFAEHWNSSVYYINQTVDGIIDRQAVGSELRYYAPTRSLLTLVDYDVSYSALNIALLQGTWQMAPGTNWNLLVDHECPDR